MKYKITYRLIGYFSAVLLLFSAIMGILSLFLQRQKGRPGGGKGFGTYLRFIDDISMGEAWLVDEDARTIELATAKQIAERHDIQITCESVLGDHTTFFFTFPNIPDKHPS